MKNLFIVFLIVCVFGLSGCATTEVKRVPIDEQIDLSGSWNDTDAMKVAETMVSQALEGQWREDYLMDHGRNPIVIVGHVANRTTEHVNSQIFTKYLERELLNSGKVVFVASPEEREQIRVEREDQQLGNTDPETMAALGKERGADYMLIGSLNSEKDEVKGKFVIFYQADLELIDLSTNTKVWMGQEQIKKFVKKKKFGM